MNINVRLSELISYNTVTNDITKGCFEYELNFIQIKF